jgi:hypothetical protein
MNADVSQMIADELETNPKGISAPIGASSAPSASKERPDLERGMAEQEALHGTRH